jgi:ribosome maturation factor RimP
MVSPLCVSGLKRARFWHAVAPAQIRLLIVPIQVAIIRGFPVKWRGLNSSSPFFLLDWLSRLFPALALTHPSLHSKAPGKPRSKAAGAPVRAPLKLREPRVAREPRPAPEVPTGPRLGWREAINVTVAGLGYELVEVDRAPKGLLRITIDRVPGRGYPRRHSDEAEFGVLDMGEFITVDDCEQVTRQLQYALEVEGLEYARLEVSSPGLDRPLKSEEHMQRFVGHAINVILKMPFQGRKNWQGVLGAAEGEPGTWQLVFKDGKAEQVFGFKFDEVREARLVPVVDFKGRKAAQTPPGAQAADPAMDDQAGKEVGTAPRGAALTDVPGEDGG